MGRHIGWWPIHGAPTGAKRGFSGFEGETTSVILRLELTPDYPSRLISFSATYIYCSLGMVCRLIGHF